MSAADGARAADDVARLRPGDRVRVTYDCGSTLTGRLVVDGGRLVLDLPGRHFVVRRADGTVESDIVAVAPAPHR